MSGDFLDYDLASDYTRLSTRTLRRAVVERELAHIKRGRRIIFRRRDLDQWLSRYTVKAVQ